ncbi:MAG: hypothetical protein HC875_16950 [Anaerolineales bacterium]|nr:hypothetical protein [Anaerolineales bacterium]
MRPIFAGEVTICSPIRLKEHDQIASFSVKHGKDRFFIRTVGMGQYEMMAELADAGTVRLFVFGYMFSYQSDRCHQDHHGVEPVWMVSLDHYDGDPATLRSIAAQWFTASLVTLNGSGSRPRLDTKPLKTA